MQKKSWNLLRKGRHLHIFDGNLWMMVILKNTKILPQKKIIIKNTSQKPLDWSSVNDTRHFRAWHAWFVRCLLWNIIYSNPIFFISLTALGQFSMPYLREWSWDIMHDAFFHLFIGWKHQNIGFYPNQLFGCFEWIIFVKSTDFTLVIFTVYTLRKI